MARTGIPASIKMAQALLESQSGQSELAVNANNHFGIKCKNDWNGNIYYYEDDDKNEEGDIVPSCFRSYATPSESYIDHSEFLLSRPRYKELFSLSKSDYMGWAQGLKRCGYATDPNYTDRLIKIVQKFNLDNLDFTNDLAESKENKGTDADLESRIAEPVEPIIPKQVIISIPKNIPGSFLTLNHKSTQKHKRKRRF